MVEKNICKHCKEPLLYAIEVEGRYLLWGLCKKCFDEGWIPNPPYNKYLEDKKPLAISYIKKHYERIILFIKSLRLNKANQFKIIIYSIIGLMGVSITYTWINYFYVTNVNPDISIPFLVTILSIMVIVSIQLIDISDTKLKEVN